MSQTLKLLKVIDRYEVKARLVPGLLSVLVLVPGGVALRLLMRSSGSQGLAVDVGVGAVIGLGLAYAASAAGNRLQQRLWLRWPFDSPTNRYLHLADPSASQQQKSICYQAIRALTGLDIESATKAGDPRQLDLVINDAVRDLRHQFRSSPHAGLLQTHNEDYGFARNLTGLRVFWLPASLASCGAAWWAWKNNLSDLTWLVAASLVVVLALIVFFFLLTYVRVKAQSYVDSFVATLSSYGAGTRSEVGDAR